MNKPLSPVEFYFDFSSPYGYLASCVIDAVCERHGRKVEWRPILLGVMFKATGNSPLISQPVKGDYSVKDFTRSARYYGIPFKMPQKFPVSGVSPARAFLALQHELPAAAKHFAHAALAAFYVDGQDISDAVVAGEIARKSAAQFKLDGDAIVAAMSSQDIKDQLRADVDEALAKGVFGSPFFIVDGEPFWGMDRVPQLEKWLESGGW
jgi:2-hydroxychromene-2-carboxylate isomerase